MKKIKENKDNVKNNKNLMLFYYLIRMQLLIY